MKLHDATRRIAITLMGSGIRELHTDRYSHSRRLIRGPREEGDNKNSDSNTYRSSYAEEEEGGSTTVVRVLCVHSLTTGNRAKPTLPVS
jgi:hypothetical protein